MAFSSRYTYTSPQHLVARLTARSLHLLALRISTYLDLKPDAVLKDWACAKIARAKPSVGSASVPSAGSEDDEVCKLIVDKFEKLGHGDVSYADIAKKAWEVGRAGLATKVIALMHTHPGTDYVFLVAGSRTTSRRSSSSAVSNERRSARSDEVC